MSSIIFVIIRIIGAGVSLCNNNNELVLACVIIQANTSSYNSYYNVIKALARLEIKSIYRIKLIVVSVHLI